MQAKYLALRLIWINPYSPVLLFYTLWEHQKTFRFSDVFSGHRKATPVYHGPSKSKKHSSEIYLGPFQTCPMEHLAKSKNSSRLLAITFILNSIVGVWQSPKYAYVVCMKYSIISEAATRRCSTKKAVLKNFAKPTGKKAMPESLF